MSLVLEHTRELGHGLGVAVVLGDDLLQQSDRPAPLGLVERDL